MAWDDPRTLALLGASAGFLDPRGGLTQGFHGALQGMQIGNQIAQQRTEADEAKNKLAKEMEQESLLRELALKHGGNTQGMLQDMISSGNVPLMLNAAKLVKGLGGQYLKSQGPDGTGSYQFANNLGQVSPTGIPLPPEKLMEINRGNQIDLIDPYAGNVKKTFGMGISPGQSASLGQAERHHQDNYALDMIKAQNSINQTKQPQFKDGYWVTPPTQDNPQGSVIATELSSAPKGSAKERQIMADKIKNTLGDDTEDLIRKSTGSGVGSLVDKTAGFFGGSTSGSEASSVLKMRAAALAGNVPRFEGPQSDADRRYYMEMVGNLGDDTVPAKIKLQSLKELRRIHSLMSTDGSIKQSVTPGASNSPGSSNNGEWSVQRIE